VNWEEAFLGVAESSYECQLYTYPKVSLSLGFENSIKEDSYLKSTTPKKDMFLRIKRSIRNKK
jgi:hypothetical protein